MVQTAFGPRREDDCPMCGRRPATTEMWETAVNCRPHYPPCDFPDHACSCGAAEDRYAIADALRSAAALTGRADQTALDGPP
jgi:hypothetical protein